MSNCVVGSGDFRLPRNIVAEHGVEGCDHLLHDRDDDDLGFFVGGGATTMWPFAAITQNQSFTIGPPANPAAKLRVQEKAAAEKRSKAKEKREECRRRAVNEKIASRERKSFIFSCEKK